MKLSIQSKIVGGVVLLMAVVTALFLYTYRQLNNQIQALSYVVVNSSPKVQNLQVVKAKALQISVMASQLDCSASTKADADKAQGVLNRDNEEIKQAFTKYEALPFVAGEEEAYKNFKSKFWDVYASTAQKIVDLSGTNKALLGLTLNGRFSIFSARNRCPTSCH